MIIKTQELLDIIKILSQKIKENFKGEIILDDMISIGKFQKTTPIITVKTTEFSIGST